MASALRISKLWVVSLVKIYRVFDSDSKGVLAEKQMFKEGKLCSTKCNGMFNSSCNIIDHTPLSMPGFSDFEVNGRHMR